MPSGLEAGLLVSTLQLSLAGNSQNLSVSVKPSSSPSIAAGCSASVKSSGCTPTTLCNCCSRTSLPRQNLKKHKSKWIRLETIQNNSLTMPRARKGRGGTFSRDLRHLCTCLLPVWSLLLPTGMPLGGWNPNLHLALRAVPTAVGQ